eukprot:gene9246-1528_t
MANNEQTKPDMKTLTSRLSNASLPSDPQKDMAGMTDPNLLKKLVNDAYQAATSSVETVTELAIQHPEFVNAVDLADRTPIFFAVLGNNIRTCDVLLRAGAMINIKDADGRTPGDWAAFYGRADCLQLFLANGLLINVPDKDGRVLLHWATAHKKPKCLQLVLVHPNVDTNVIDSENMTPLHWAAFHNHSKHIQLLLDAAANPLPLDMEGKTPLHWTSNNKTASAAKLLLTKHPELANIADFEARTPLHYCVGDENKHVAQALLKHSMTNRISQDVLGRTPLHWAVALCSETMINLLVRYHDALSIHDDQGATPVHYASQINNETCTKAVLRGIPKNKIDVTDWEHRTPLFWAIANDLITMVQFFLKAGADPNHIDITGRNALHVAVARRSITAVKLLLDYKVKKNIQDSAKQTPLLLAVEHSLNDIIYSLLDAGADASMLDFQGRTILHAAIMTGNVETLDIALQAFGEAINYADQYGETPLHYASNFGFLESINELLRNGAEVNVIDLKGITPLHWACSQGHKDIIAKLLSYGAFPNFTDDSEYHLTPLDYALYGDFQDCVNLLLEAGGVTGAVLRNYCASRIQAAYRVYRQRKAKNSQTAANAFLAKEAKSSRNQPQGMPENLNMEETSPRLKPQNQTESEELLKPSADSKKNSKPGPTFINALKQQQFRHMMIVNEQQRIRSLRTKIAAARVIQCWWRMHLRQGLLPSTQTKPKGAHASPSKTSHLLPYNRKQLLAALTIQRILNYRPKPCRPIHCHLLPPTPSAIDLSWASAKETYLKPTQRKPLPQSLKQTHRCE